MEKHKTRPSLYTNEGHPGSVIEALMVGLPVITSDLSGVREIINHRVNGLLVGPGEVDQLSKAMEELMLNENLCLKLAEKALETSKRFSAEEVILQLANTVGIEV